jgi:hypothetical protein
VVDVEMEAALLGVERLGPVDVSDWDDYELELEVHARPFVGVAAGYQTVRALETHRRSA